MYTLDNVLQKLREHKPELQRKYPVYAPGVFGSQASEEATDQSDIDTAVEFTETSVWILLNRMIKLKPYLVHRQMWSGFAPKPEYLQP